MSLIKCKECWGQVSTQAKFCPHCGATLPPPKTSGLIIFASVIVAVIILNLMVDIIDRFSASPAPEARSANQSTPAEPIPPAEPTQPAAPHDDAASARGACMLFIKQGLNDPSSAEFGHSSEAVVEQMKDGTWLVYRKVRAKNAYNATVLSIFECHMRLSGENWTALSIKQIQ